MNLSQVFYKADLDADNLLDRKELALWLHQNELENKAAEIKADFWVGSTGFFSTFLVHFLVFFSI